MKITSTLKPSDKATRKQLEQINHAAGMPIIHVEDYSLKEIIVLLCGGDKSTQSRD
jgi:hypothetical protein